MAHNKIRMYQFTRAQNCECRQPILRVERYFQIALALFAVVHGGCAIFERDARDWASTCFVSAVLVECVLELCDCLFV